MSIVDLLNFRPWALLIEFAGALLIVGYFLAALLALLRTRDLNRARRLAVNGVLIGLSFKLAGTLLKMLQLQTWQQILMFIAILTLRTALKRFFVWEQKRLKRAQQSRCV